MGGDDCRRSKTRNDSKETVDSVGDFFDPLTRVYPHVQRRRETPKEKYWWIRRVRSRVETGSIVPVLLRTVHVLRNVTCFVKTCRISMMKSL